MINKKLTDLTEQQVKKLFVEFLTENFPEKLKFNPTIIDYNDKTVKFGMKKHYGILNLSAEKLIKTNANNV